MSNAFFADLVERLINQGFEPIRGFSEEINWKEEIKYLGFLNTSASVWYSFLVINTAIVQYDEFLSIRKSMMSFFQDIQNKTGIKKIISVNLFVFENNLEYSYDSLLNADTFGLDEKILSVYWAANTQEKSLRFGVGNPDKVLNLQDIVKKSLNNNFHVSGEETSVSQIKHTLRNASEKRPKIKAVSQNTALTYLLIVSNLLIWVWLELSGGSENTANLIRFGARTPTFFQDKEYYRLFNSMFLHVGLMHLLSNCLGLYIFGGRIEKYFGKVKFFLIYFVSGLLGGVLGAIFTSGVAAGASGAIFGLVGAVFAATYKTKLGMEGLDKNTMIIYIGYSMVFGLIYPAIDNFGHIGGLIGGVLLGYILYTNGKEAV